MPTKKSKSINLPPLQRKYRVFDSIPVCLFVIVSFIFIIMLYAGNIVLPLSLSNLIF